MRGQVFLKTPDMPSDPLLTDQWYLNDINVLPVWNGNGGKSYTGEGIRIGQFEPGMPYSTGPEIFDYRHYDLQDNANRAWLSNPNITIPQRFSNHATLVAGVIAAARNGEGGVGVAYNAQLSGHYIQGTGLTADALTKEIRNALAQFRNYDIVNNSWGATSNFDLTVVPVGALDRYTASAIQNGRSGLGTIIVMAGGNDRQDGGNTNTSALSANRAAIVTGATNAAGDISTLVIKKEPFSNPGASILVSAPGSNITSTSRILISDDGTVFGSDASVTQGTSFATPIISGVVALMLEANPNLGWRDVQQILAITAKRVNDPDTDLIWNAAKNWNGGGMHTSHDYGFGEVDARAAVRLAETWVGQHVSHNERHLGNGEGSLKETGARDLNLATRDGRSIERTLAIGAGIKAEHVTVSIDITHPNWGDLVVELISPTGTVSKLVANPGTSAKNPGGDKGIGRLTFAMDTTHDMGENAAGNWKIKITDRRGRGAGKLHGWKVDVYGSDWNETAESRNTAGQTPVTSTTTDNIYFYTDEFAEAPGDSRSKLTDADGGTDTINASAVSSGSRINLNNGSASIIAGRALTIRGDVENAYGGDGDDTLSGNALSNHLRGGRGNDTLSGGGGVDLLDGGAGNNTLSGDAGADIFVIRKRANGIDTITDFTPSTSGEKIKLVGFDGVTQFSELTITKDGSDTRLLLGDGQKILLKNIQPSEISEQNFVFVIDGGGDGDSLWGDYSSYVPTDGDDWFEGGSGNDVLIGGAGNDYLHGGAGNDVLMLEGDMGHADGMDYEYRGARVGGVGADTFLVAADGGGSSSLSFSNGKMSVSNLIADFDINKSGEVIDLTNLTWIRSFADLSISVFIMGGVSMSRVSAGSGAEQLTIHLLGVEREELTAAHFKFAADTGAAGTASDDPLTGDAGANILDGGTGADTMTGRTGDDTYIVDDAGDRTVELPGGGFDTVKASVSHTLSANMENLVLTGTAAINGTGNKEANRITGNAANNILDGGAGVDTLLGGAGDDTYVVDSQADTVIEHANAGTDTVQSSVSYTLGKNIENLQLIGSASVNATGNVLVNTLIGNSGNNLLDGADGADTMKGGAGNDIYFVDNAADAVVENKNEGIDTIYSTVNTTLGENVENLVLAVGATNGTGNDLNNTIVGNSKNNTLSGGVGNDTLNGGKGVDTLIGGTGDDIYVIDSTTDTITELANAGNDTVLSSITFDLSAKPNLENVVLTGTANINATGNAADNQLIGNAGANTLSGGAGDDTLLGGAGNDKLFGGANNDTLLGGAGNDKLFGGANNDTLFGGAGTDTLTGGTGNDTYFFGKGAGQDTIVENDTTAGNIDTVQIIGVSRSEVSLSKTGNNLVISINGTTDTLIVQNYFSGSRYKIEKVVFDNGTEWDASQLDLATAIVPTTSGNVYGTSYDDTFDLRNPANTSHVRGGNGNDTYVFGRGAGKDRIADYGGSTSDVDTIKITGGVLPSDVTLRRLNHSLIISIRNTNDQLVVYKHFAADHKIEKVVFDNGTEWDAFQLDNLNTNTAPTLETPIADQRATEDSVFSFTVPANIFADGGDIGDALTLTATLANGDALPTWLVLDADTGTFTGIPDNGAVDDIDIKVTATDKGGASVSDTFVLSITNTNDAPTFTGSLADQTVAAGSSAFTFAIPSGTFADVDVGDTLTYTATQGNGSALPNWLVIDPATGALGNKSGSQVPAIDNLQIIIIATDSAGLSVSSNAFTLDVTNAPTFFTGDLANQIVTKGSAFTFAIPSGTFADVDVGDTLTYTATQGNGSALPNWLVIDPATGALGNKSGSQVPAIDNLQIIIIATDSAGLSVSSNVFNLTVKAAGGEIDLTTDAANTIATRGQGNDTYLFTTGAGKDVIVDHDNTPGNMDTIKITGGVLPSDVTLRRLNHSLIISIRNTNDQLVVYKHFAADHKIEKVVFDNGTEWDAFQLGLATAIVPTTSGNVYGTSDDDTFDLRNPANTSHVRGGTGNDTYVFGRGAGKDRIADNGSTSDVDTIKITGGVLPSDVTLRRLNHSLIISIRNTNDQLVVYKHFAADHKIEKVVFDNGTEWDAFQLGLATAIVPTTSGNVYGTSDDDTFDLRNPANTSHVRGGTGNDTYVFGRGAGKDRIADYGGSTSDVDTIKITGGVLPSDVTLRRLNHSLIISIRNTNDQLVVYKHFAADHKIEKVVFDNGTEWGAEKLNAAAIRPGAGGETRGAEKLNVVATLPGAGSIQGTDGDDTYYDLRDPANSTTDDVSGNDTYRFAAGAGQDVIRDWGSTPNNNDTLEFLSGVDANQLWLRQDGNNLEVSIIGTNDKVTIEDWYSGSVYHIEEFTTSDGKTLMHTQVDNLVQAMAAFAPPASGETTLPDDYQRTLDPVIAANWQ